MHRWESCTGVSGNYAQQGYYKRRFATLTNAIVILSGADPPDGGEA